MLLDARANVNHQDKFGYAPLHIAALNEGTSYFYNTQTAC